MPYLPRTSAFRAICLLIITLSATACGNAYKVHKVKQYTLAITSGSTPAMITTFQTLIKEYNGLAGSSILTYTNNAAVANSSIKITKGLVTSSAGGLGAGKVGLGQWLSETSIENSVAPLPGQMAKETIRYSMRVEFDLDYMTTKTHYELQKLFFHEIGHGLELNHDESDIHDVMYPDVGAGDTKDFNTYFAYVRSYMADQ